MSQSLVIFWSNHFSRGGCAPCRCIPSVGIYNDEIADIVLTSRQVVNVMRNEKLLLFFFRTSCCIKLAETQKLPSIVSLFMYCAAMNTVTTTAPMYVCMYFAIATTTVLLLLMMFGFGPICT